MSFRAFYMTLLRIIETALKDAVFKINPAIKLDLKLDLKYPRLKYLLRSLKPKTENEHRTGAVRPVPLLGHSRGDLI